jgi:hypothetical protein
MMTDADNVIIARRYLAAIGRFAAGDCVALEVRWTGTLAVPIGTLSSASEMTARSAMFL